MVNLHDPKMIREFQRIIHEVEEISEDLSKYLHYYKRREPLLRDILSESSLN